jgi:ERCC4-related helicase
MIYINRTKMPRQNSLEDTFYSIKKFLLNENSIIVNEHGAALSDNDILNILANQTEIHFQTKKVSEIEKETLEELQNYVEKAEIEIERLRENDNMNEIVQAFQDIVEAIFYFSKLQNYYQLTIIDMNQIQELTQKSFDRMKESNTDYLLDVIEFEFLPMIKSLKDAIEERIIQ